MSVLVTTLILVRKVDLLEESGSFDGLYFVLSGNLCLEGRFGHADDLSEWRQLATYCSNDQVKSWTDLRYSGALCSGVFGGVP